MAEGFPTLSENGLPEDKIVLAMVGKEFQGFLLTVDTVPDPDEHRAYYVDEAIELIDPITGTPRPEPDPAVRTKFLKLLTPVGSAAGFTGQMRRLAQCYQIQGRSVPYRTSYTLSHGILEYPYPRAIGATVEEENLNASLRKFWIIEISEDGGVYVAPVTVGRKCLSCMTSTINAYLHGGRVDLAWTFANNNEAGLVQQLLTAEDIEEAYDDVGSWAGNVSWAFSYSGQKASNVVLRYFADDTVVATGATLDSTFEDPPGSHYAIINAPGHGVLFNEEVRAISNSAFTFKLAGGQAGYDDFPPTTDTLTFPFDPDDEDELVDPFTIKKAAHFTGQRFDIDFAVEYPKQAATIVLLSPGVAQVTSAAHGISEGALAVVEGADQPEYNGAHAASSVTADTFLIGVSGSPVSPATGTILISGTHLPPTITADLTVGQQKQFNHVTGAAPLSTTANVLWHQRSSPVTRFDPLTRTPGIYFETPPTGGVNFTFVYPQECPLFIYYDGEDELLLTWHTDFDEVDFTFGFTAGAVDHRTTLESGTDVPHSNAMLFVNEREAIAMLQATRHGSPITSIDMTYDLLTRGAVDQEVFTLEPGALSIESLADHVIIGWDPDDPPMGGFIFGYDPEPVNNRTFTSVTDIQATGGALKYSDPNLTPADQSGNRFRVFDGQQLTAGGFAELAEPFRAFIGQV